MTDTAEQLLAALRRNQPTTPPAPIRLTPAGTPLPVQVPGQSLRGAR
ncbi:hypothetical protein [Carbonactinospora thermoautotrophica]|nr:hypothetical protein [Carbonactinospora thermoautotrophica]